MSLYPIPPAQTPEQHAAELETEHIELASMETETAPGKPPTKEAFERAAVSADLF